MKWIDIAYPKDLSKTHGVDLIETILKSAVETFNKYKDSYKLQDSVYPGAPVWLNHPDSQIYAIAWIRELKLEDGRLKGWLDDRWGRIKYLTENGYIAPTAFSGTIAKLKSGNFRLNEVSILPKTHPALDGVGIKDSEIFHNMGITDAEVASTFNSQELRMSAAEEEILKIQLQDRILKIEFDKSLYPDKPSVEKWLKENNYEAGWIDEGSDKLSRYATGIREVKYEELDAGVESVTEQVQMKSKEENITKGVRIVKSNMEIKNKLKLQEKKMELEEMKKIMDAQAKQIESFTSQFAELKVSLASKEEAYKNENEKLKKEKEAAELKLKNQDEVVGGLVAKDKAREADVFLNKYDKKLFPAIRADFRKALLASEVTVIKMDDGEGKQVDMETLLKRIIANLSDREETKEKVGREYTVAMQDNEEAESAASIIKTAEEIANAIPGAIQGKLTAPPKAEGGK